MKKYKYLKYLVLLVVLVLAFAFTRSKQFSIITFSHLYSQYMNVDEVVRIPILVNDDTYYTDEDSLKSIYILNDDNKIPMHIDEIILEDYSMYYNNEEYNVYMFDLVPNINSDYYKINLSDSILELNYVNDLKVELEIGDFNIMYSESSNDLAVKSLSPLINEINGYDTVVAFIIGLENISEEEIEIDGFNINSNPAKVNNTLVKELERNDYDIFTDILSIVPEYNYYSLTDDKTSVYIGLGETKYIIVPITYERINFLYRFPIEITYNDKSYVNDDFIFINYGYFPDFILNTKKKYEFNQN